MRAFLITVLLISPATAQATDGRFESLIWRNRVDHKTSLFRDRKARRVGDILTIIVRERSDIDNRDERAMEKQTATDGKFNLATTTGGDLGTSSANADINASKTSNRTFDGRSEFTSEREYLDRVSVTVVEVLPNGNLVIEGQRKRSLTGESRCIQVSGVVRPVDVLSNNTVQSQQIANFSVSYEGSGPESSFSNQGFLGKIVNKIWPF